MVCKLETLVVKQKRIMIKTKHGITIDFYKDWEGIVFADLERLGCDIEKIRNNLNSTRHVGINRYKELTSIYYNIRLRLIVSKQRKVFFF